MTPKTNTLPAKIPYVPYGLIALIGVGLYLTSRYSDILFHTLVELSSIAIGWSLFVLVWNSRQWMNQRCCSQRRPMQTPGKTARAVFERPIVLVYGRARGRLCVS